MRRNLLLACLAAAILAVAYAGTALAGAPPNASLAGPTRGGLDLALPYMQTGRGAAMGGATVALDGSDTQNPAALGFMKGVVSFSAGYGSTSYDDGPDVAMYNSQIVFPMPFLGGTSKIMGYHMKTTDRDASRMMGGMEAEVWATQYGIAYGRQIPLRGLIPGKLAIGFAGYPNDPSQVWLRDGTGATVAHGRGMSKIGSMRLGFLYKPTDLINIGGDFSHIKDHLYATYAAFPGIRYESNYHVNIYTIGAAARLGHRGLLGRTTITAQYLGGHANGQGVDQAYVVMGGGIEHRIPITEVINIMLRSGYYAHSPTYGFGLTLPYRLTLDYAYVPNYGNNLAKAFGHGALHSVCVTKGF